jgi:hypothetical protein
MAYTEHRRSQTRMNLFNELDTKRVLCMIRLQILVTFVCFYVGKLYLKHSLNEIFYNLRNTHQGLIHTYQMVRHIIMSIKLHLLYSIYIRIRYDKLFLQVTLCLILIFIIQCIAQKCIPWKAAYLSTIRRSVITAIECNQAKEHCWNILSIVNSYLKAISYILSEQSNEYGCVKLHQALHFTANLVGKDSSLIQSNCEAKLNTIGKVDTNVLNMRNTLRACYSLFELCLL